MSPHSKSQIANLKLLCVFLAKHPRCLRFVAKLGVGFIQAYHGARTGREAAVWVECDPFGGEELQRLAHSSRDGQWLIDAPGRHIHAPEANLKLFAQLLKYCHVTRLRGGEFHGQMLNLEPVQMMENRAVAAFVRAFSACPRSGAAAEVHGHLDAVDAA